MGEDCRFGTNVPDITDPKAKDFYFPVRDGTVASEITVLEAKSALYRILCTIRG